MELNAFDRVLMALAPGWALRRARARAVAAHLQRHYEAASGGYRTTKWPRSSADANTSALGALATLRNHARDLVRNNAWAQRAVAVHENNTVGWGLTPKGRGAAGESEGFLDAWRAWAESTACDADGLFNFCGLQQLVMRTVVESGEVLVRRRWRRTEDGLSLPLQLQVLEPDFLDITKDGLTGEAGGPIIQGVEFDKLGRRAAYWLYDQHPGAGRLSVRPGASFVSRRINARDVVHVYRVDRPGQVRGITWFASVILRLKDFDDYDDATLMRAKIAACYAAFITDTDGMAQSFGTADDDDPAGPTETLEPGLITQLRPGQEIQFGTPPQVSDHASFTPWQLRRVAAGIGVTYEDLTGDYGNVNYSSARMARLAHWAGVHKHRWNMLVPRFCDPAWAWAVEAAALIGLLPSDTASGAEWSAPPMPMLEPDKEGRAYQFLVRTGAMTPSGMIREQGGDPARHFEEMERDFKMLRQKGLVLDIDPSAVSQAGVTQARGGGAGGGTATSDDEK